MPSRAAKRKKQDEEDELVLIKIEQVKCSVLPSEQDLSAPAPSQPSRSQRKRRKKKRQLAVVPEYLAEKLVDGTFIHIPVVPRPQAVTREVVVPRPIDDVEQDMKEANRKSKRRKGDPVVEVSPTEVQYLREGEHKVFRFRLPILVNWRGYSLRFIHEKELQVFHRLLKHYSLSAEVWAPICSSLEGVLNAELWPRMKVFVLRLVLLIFSTALPIIGYAATASLIALGICLGVSVFAAVAGCLVVQSKLKRRRKSCRKAMEVAIQKLNDKIAALELRGRVCLCVYPESTNGALEGLTLSMEEIYTRRELQVETVIEGAELSTAERNARTRIPTKEEASLCIDCKRLRKFTRDEGLASITDKICVCARKDREEFERMLLGDAPGKSQDDNNDNNSPEDKEQEAVEESSSVCRVCNSKISPT